MSTGLVSRLTQRLGGPWRLPGHSWHGVLALSGLGALALVVAVGGHLWREHGQLIETARSRTEDMARMLEAHTQQTLQRVDLSMGHVELALARTGYPGLSNTPAERDRLRALLPVDGLIRSLSVLDTSGRLVVSTATDAPSPALASPNRDFFLAHRDEPGRGLFLGATVLGRVTGLVTVPVSIRLDGPGGSFQGVLVGALTADYFQRVYDGIGTGKQGFVTLFSRSGAILARSPFDQALMLRNWADTPLFRQHLPSAPVNTVRQVVVADGVERIYSYRALADFPVVATVGLSLDEVLAPWRRDALNVTLLTLAVLLGQALLTWRLVRHLRTRRQGEELLEQSRERVRALSDVTFEAVFISAKGLCLEQNAQARRMFGYSDEEAHGRPGSDWIALQDRQRVTAHMASGYEQPYEVMARRKDGSTFPAVIKARMMTFRGEPVRVTSVLDTSAIKQAQAESASLQRRMQATLDALPDLLFEVDADGRILNWHAARTDLLAVPPEQFLGRRCTEALPHGAATACEQAVREALASGSSRGIQYSLAVPLGTRWFELSAAPMDSQDGQARHVIMLARDITERWTMQETLRQREQHQRALLDNFPFLVWLKDELGRYLAVNARVAQAFGFVSAEAVVGKTDVDLFPLELARRYREEDSTVMASGQPLTFDDQIVIRGVPGWFETSKSPLMIDGKAMGTVGFARDISARRQHEAFRQQQSQRVEHLSHRLVRAHEETRRRFASDLHDRTSPNLAALRINLDFIASASPERRLGRGFEERVDDTRALIEDTTASIREICADLHPHGLEGVGLMAVVRGYAYQFGRRTGLQVTVACPHAEQRLTPELELALFRIIQEAMTNCAKHAQARRLEVLIDLLARPLRVCIADDGVGVQPEQAAPSAGRSGLGLQTMRETAEFVGARLTVDSPAGHGTRITVEMDQPPAQQQP